MTFPQRLPKLSAGRKGLALTRWPFVRHAESYPDSTPSVNLPLARRHHLHGPRLHYMVVPIEEDAMSRKSSGKAHRQGISLVKLHRMFPDDDAARAWLEKQIWPQGPYCPHCGSFNVQAGIKHRTMTHRCRDCPNRPQFSLKTGTIMQASNLGYQTWAIAIYLLTTNLKGIATMKLHRDLEISYKSAWHLAHRLRKAFESGEAPVFQGPVEADEAYFGGKRRNMHKAKRKELAEAGRGTVGKTAVVGVKDRATNAVVAEVV